MKSTPKTTSIEGIIADIEIGDLNLDHEIQRKPNQFNDYQKSLLIDSILRGYPIPTIYIYEENGTNYVIDGKQRLTTIQSYMNNEFPLHRKLETLEYEEKSKGVITTKECKLKGFIFDKLPAPLQKKIKRTQLTQIFLSECEEDEINEIFLRLNNGTPLTTVQKLRAITSNEVKEAIKEIAELPFYSEVADISDGQRLKSVDDACVIQTLMLLNGETNFSKSGMTRFAESYVYDAKDFDAIKSATEEITKIFPDGKVKGMTRISIPLIVATLTKCTDLNRDIYLSQIKEFFDDYENNQEYRDLCKGGTSAKTNVEARLKFFTDML